jgi:hypothetical protein
MVAIEYTTTFLQNERSATRTEQELDEQLIGIDQALDGILNGPNA